MDWKDIIEEELSQDYGKELINFVKERRRVCTVYPPEEDVFKVFKLTRFDDVRVVILGQDPYHQPGQAMGLSFSVHQNQALPKSLINIYKELEDDLGVTNTHGDLTHWSNQGVFLLNTLLTVERGAPLSHQNKGWERFTDRVLFELGNREAPIVFILWGKKAQEKKHMFKSHHIIIESSHPSPLGAYRGFWKSKPFSRTNDVLQSWGKKEIDWSV